MSLFKEEPEDKPKKKDRNKIYVIALYILNKLNDIIIWTSILANMVFIVFMLIDFNVGVFLFIFNQYIIISYYFKIREERKKKMEEQ